MDSMTPQPQRFVGFRTPQRYVGRRALALLFCALGIFLATCPVWASTTVTLSSTTSPTIGQAGITNVNVTGSGFPSGFILPSNVLVTIQPTTSGGVGGTVTASAVTTILGSVRRVTFQIPASIVVSSPMTYKVSIAGTTSTGIAFSSGNTSDLTVDPPATITVVSPSTGQPGQAISVAITGLYTSFVPTSTVANFGPGISVGGAPEGTSGPVTVNGPTSLTAQVVIDPSQAAGMHTVTATTGAQQASLAGGFLVYHATTTGADGSASFPADNVTVLVKDIASQQPLAGIMIALLNNGIKEGFWLVDPSGKYLPDFVDPSPLNSVTVFLQQATGTIQSTAAQIGSDFVNFMTSGDIVSYDNIQQVGISLAQAALQSVVQLLELAACSSPPGALALSEINALLQQLASLSQLQCSSSTDIQGCYVAIDGMISNATTVLLQGGLPSSCQNILLNNLPSDLPFVVDKAINGFERMDVFLYFEDFLVQGLIALNNWENGYRCFAVYQPNPSQINPITNTLFPFLVQAYSTSACGLPRTVPGLVSTTISGTVQDATTGNGIAGAIVYALQSSASGGFRVTTASDGTFSGAVTGSPGVYTIAAEASGHISNSVAIEFEQNNQQISPIIISLAPFSPPQPVIQSVTTIVAQPTQGVVITGRGFGNTPPQTVTVGDGSVDTLACNVTTPALAIHDNGAGPDAWDAGQDTCTGGPDHIGINIVSWSDTEVVLNGFGSALGSASNPGTFNIAPGDSLTVEVFGPNNSGVATYNLQVPPTAPIPPSGSVTVTVPANQGWTDAGINLNVADTVTISASGLIILTTDGHIPPMSPAGFPPNCTAAEVYGQFFAPFPAFQLPCWSLIGRIGANGPIFEVGTNAIFQAQSSGEFYLGVNDNNLGDNSGNWTAAISVVP
jgi:hypothetical protein